MWDFPIGLVQDVEKLFEGDSSGHDMAHTMRVVRLSARIAAQEHADQQTVMLAALLHDVDDFKLTGDVSNTCPRALGLMEKYQIDREMQERVCEIITQVSFKGTDTQVPSTLEGKIVQDADRLDAIGAVGIARAFAFGGSRGRAMYTPDEEPTLHMDAETYRSHQGCTINHFYEKLLLLKDQMNTSAARSIAEVRHSRMVLFLHDFMEEWNGES